MRKILRDTCIFAALMILTVFAFSITGVGFTEEIKLVFLLFGLALILSVVNYVFDEITALPILTGYIIKYFVITGIVIAFGFIAGWFYPSNFWMAFIYVGAISVVVYALDSVRTENDIEEINDMVKRSNNEKIESRPLKARKGWKVLAVLILVMTVLCGTCVAGLVCVSKSVSDTHARQKSEAESAGYGKVYTGCRKEDNVLIDGKLYECYSTVEWLFAGDIGSRDVNLLFEYGSSYIDGTEGEEEKLRIYCRDKEGSYGDERFIEPYSIYNPGMQKYADYCFDGFEITGAAVLILTFVLIVYIAVYLIRKKTSSAV